MQCACTCIEVVQTLLSAAFEDCGFHPGHVTKALTLPLHCSDDDSEAGEHEDAEARAQRRARTKQQEAATAAHFGSSGGGGWVPQSGPSSAAPAVDLPASRPNSDVQPSRSGAAHSAGLQPAATAAAATGQGESATQLGQRLHSERLFGGASAAAPSVPQQQDGGNDSDRLRSGVSIGPASRTVTGSLAAGAAAGGAGAAVAAVPTSGADAAKGGSQNGGSSGLAEHSSSEDEGEDTVPPDAMRPLAGMSSSSCARICLWWLP